MKFWGAVNSAPLFFCALRRGGFATVRQPFEEVNAVLGAWSIGEGSLEEALEEGASAR